MSDNGLQGGRTTKTASARLRLGRLPLTLGGFPLSLRGVGVALPLAYLAASFACSSGHERPSDLGNGLDLNHGRLDAGNDPADNPDESPDAGPGSTDDLPTGDAGVVEPNPCGDGVLDPGEDCEAALPLTDTTCLSRGFDTGSLSCGADCRFDTSSCSGVETCFDGRDNDGDGLMDCADSECASSCADPCQAPPLVPENATVTGSTRGRTATLGASCSEAEPSGPDVVYQVQVTQDSKLDVRLSSTQALNLSVRTSCGDLGSELVCSSQTRLTVDALAGETFFIVLDGEYATDAGEYVLEVHTHQVFCGDALREETEACDDGNTDDGDGCDSACDLEPSESETNDARFQSDSYSAAQPWFAEIGSEGDVDYYRVSVPTAPGSIVVRTLDLGDNACAYNLMDTVVDIFDINARANTLLVNDDDSGVGKCSLAVATGLSTGNYFVRVKAADTASPPTFPYHLDISVGACGDGNLTVAEECDDGNFIDGDGCDASCHEEFGG
jgi:cysteine-rich repeat protein